MSIGTFFGSRWSRAWIALAAVSMLSAVTAGARAATPPDGRAYELVSPPNKFGGIPNFPPVSALGFFDYVTISGAPVNGERVMWLSTAPFAGSTSGLPVNYLSTRAEDGWETRQLSPDPTDPHANAFLAITQVVDTTETFSTNIFATQQQYDPLSQGAPFRKDLYAQAPDGTLTWLTRPAGGGGTSVFAQAGYSGRDEDASHVLFATSEALDPATTGQEFDSLYLRTGNQTLPVGVDNGGVAIGGCGSALGWSQPAGNRLTHTRLGAVSQDGSRIFFTTPARTGAGGPVSCEVPRQLYLRTNAATTTHISASRRTIPDPGGTQSAAFQGATQDGSTVFFLSSEALIDDALAGDGTQLLYQYDVLADELTLLTPNSGGSPGVEAVLGVAPDGSRLYFIATADLAPGATADNYKIYMYEAGEGFTFIGGLAALGDANPILFSDTSRQLRMTDDGSILVFAIPAGLRGFDTGSEQAVYRYDATTDDLACLSCARPGEPTLGASHLTEDTGGDFPRYKRTRNIASGGQQVFFESPQRLVDRDDNSVMDVYEWHDGEIHLISGGHNEEPAFFMDSANDGDDVFFTTAERLVPQDVDGDTDVYVARTGSGFPAGSGGPVLCIDDQCQGQPSTSPVLPSVGSDSDFGDGNVAETAPVALRLQRVSAEARRRFARTGKLTLRVRAGGAGTARAVARARIGGRSKVVARARATLALEGTARLRLTLSKAAQERLARAGRLKVTIVVAFPGATSRRATLTLVQPEQQR